MKNNIKDRNLIITLILLSLIIDLFIAFKIYNFKESVVINFEESTDFPKQRLKIIVNDEKNAIYGITSRIDGECRWIEFEVPIYNRKKFLLVIPEGSKRIVINNISIYGLNNQKKIYNAQNLISDFKLKDEMKIQVINDSLVVDANYTGFCIESKILSKSNYIYIYILAFIIIILIETVLLVAFCHLNIYIRNKGINTEIIVFLVGFICFSFILMCLGEWLIRESISDVLEWINYRPSCFFINLVIIMLAMLFCYFIFDNIGESFSLIGFLYLSLCIIDSVKYMYRGEYLSINDFMLISEAFNVINTLDLNLIINKYSIVALIGYAILVLLAFLYKNKQHKWRIRIWYGGIIVILFCCAVFLCGQNSLLEKIGIYKGDFFKADNYTENGFLEAMINDYLDGKIKKPEKYSKETVCQIINEYPQRKRISSIKPNVIMIMCETMFDVDKISQFDFSKDPLTEFKEYQMKFTNGNIGVSVLGGGTAQTEYEVLTGNMVEFTGIDNIAYMNIIKNNQNSLVNLFKDKGYKTIAIHPYKKEFYNRDSVYKKLGFDNFFSEESFINPQKNRQYISDLDTMNKIIEQYNANCKEGPVFIHTVTMENHQPYNQKFDVNGITVNNKQIKEESKDLVKTYANSLNNTSQSIEYIFKYFENVKYPTVIVVYGDHAPNLGENYAIYREVGYIGKSDKLTLKEYVNLYETPFVIWNNYGLEKRSYDLIDASYLGAIMLDSIGFKDDTYYNYLCNYMKNINAYTGNYIIDSNGGIKDCTNEQEKIQLEKLRILQYDRIFGKKYLDDIK